MDSVLVVGIDVDGVLRDFVSGLTIAYRARYPDHEIKPVTGWELHHFFPVGHSIYEFLWNDPEVGRVMAEEAPSYDGATEFMAALGRMKKIEAAIVTHQPNSRLRQATWQWLQHHSILEHVDSVIMLSGALRKGDISRLDVLLDDHEHNLESCQGQTIPVCMTRPWNDGNWAGLTVHSYEEFLDWVRTVVPGS